MSKSDEGEGEICLLFREQKGMSFLDGQKETKCDRGVEEFSLLLIKPKVMSLVDGPIYKDAIASSVRGIRPITYEAKSNVIGGQYPYKDAIGSSEVPINETIVTKGAMRH